MFAQGHSSPGWHSPSGVLPSPPAQYDPAHFSPNADTTGNDDTLQRIYSAANADVEMKDDFVTKLYLVLDTNVLIDYLDVIQRFNEDIERLGMPVTIIIPSVLLSELDGLKKREKVGWFASRASAWILNKMKERKTVHVQSRRETCGLVLAPHEQERRNDMWIYDCCQFFARRGHVIFISGDMNLQSTVDSINTDSVGRADLFADILTVMPDRRGWSSRALARKLADSGVNIPGLRIHPDEEPKYRRSRNTTESRKIVLGEPDDDDEVMMDVDDVGPPPQDDDAKKHALDALHLQVVDHFALLLKDLAQRVRTSAGDVADKTISLHAAGWLRKEFSEWTVGDCLDYLEFKLAQLKKGLRPRQPPLQWFLRRERGDRQGGRAGKEWSRQAWNDVADALEELGTKFEDGAMLVSAQYLRQETEYAFHLQPRPSGR